MRKRDYIADKRSKLRDRTNKPKNADNKRHIGSVLALVLLFGLILTGYSATKKFSTSKDVIYQTQPVQKQTPAPTKSVPKESPEPQNNAKPGVTSSLTTSNKGKTETTHILGPKIKIHSPPNATINTSIPILDLTIKGDNLDTVWFSIDNETKYILNNTLMFFDSFEKDNKHWTPISGKWVIEEGVYSQKSFDENLVSFMDIGNITNYIYEVQATKISGKEGFLIPFKFHEKYAWWNIGGWGNTKSSVVGISDPIETGTDDIVESSKLYSIQIEVKGNVARGWLNKNLKWEITRTPSQVIGTTNGMGLGTWSTFAQFDNVAIFTLSPENKNKIIISAKINELTDDIKELMNGQHHITLYVNNTAGNLISATRYFTINTKSKKPPTIGDTITKDIFAVTLNKYSPIEEVKYPSTYAGLYAMVDITVENVGKVKKDVKFDADTILMDDLGNQYISKKLNRNDEMVQGILYPGGKKRGILYFSPQMSLKAKKVKLIIILGDDKYEFEFKAF